MRSSGWSSDVCSSDRPRQKADASDVLDALSRRHDVGNPYAEAPADRDDLSLCNECAIREHVERRTGLTVQFDDAALVQVQKIAYPQLRAADLHRKADVDFLKQPQIGAAVLPQRSEEHTSELPSLMRNSYAVFCLKKTKNNI